MDPTADPLNDLRNILTAFEEESVSANLRERITALIPAHEALRSLGKATVPGGLSLSARDRLLVYFRAYPRTVLHEKELMIVAGISEWARRVRELRVEFGWRIITGVTAGNMLVESDINTGDIDLTELSPTDYVLLDTEQDRDAAHRWNVANEIRKKRSGSRERILEYLRMNVGKRITGEELRYVAKSTEWARRVRELRTEEGWPIVTRQSGNPSLSVGVYVLEEDRQAPAHDRHIREATRRQALQRDNYTCRRCGWNYEQWNPDDPRFLELHHVIHHAEGGSNQLDNLMTYCNVCHDEVHRLDQNR